MQTKIDIFSGFLGAGKTTLIRKLIKEAYANEKIVLIENEFGEIGIDGDFLQDAGIEIKEMSQGCICCSLVGDFTAALKKVLEEMQPQRIIIEPSGVGKLSDVIKAVKNVDSDEIVLNSFTTVCDAKKVQMYAKNFGEFYNDQIENASCIVLSRSQDLSADKLDEIVRMIREKNSNATIITTPWDQISGKTIVETMEHKYTLNKELDKLAAEVKEHDEECCCHHHDHDEHDEHCCHHHDHDEHCEHHHDEDEECCCHHDHDEHEEHHHHHADEVFTSWGIETNRQYDYKEIENILKELDNQEKYGMVLRAKGIVASKDGKWLYFDYVPEETDIREGQAIAMGRLCVIGSKMNEQAIAELFK